MNKEFKKMVVELDEIISDHVFLYFTKNFKSECESGILLNLVISSHISSIVNMMTIIAKNSDGNSDVIKNVDLFVKKLIRFIEQDHKLEMEKIFKT